MTRDNGLEGVGRRHFGKGRGEENGGTSKKLKKNNKP